VTSARTVHLLHRNPFQDLLLGPELRVARLAATLAEAGHRVVVHAPASTTNPLVPGVELRPLAPGFTRAISPGDAVVAGELLPARATLELLRGRVPFHWDCYGLSLPETLSFTGTWPWRRSLADRRRKMVRYRMLFARAERTWVSHAGQGHFLAALLASSPRRGDAAAAFDAPARLLEIPMGTPETPPPRGAGSPYPSHLRGRPILLWGGGIWNWFDVPTVVEAFGVLARRGQPHALFFLSGRNEATRDYDAPLQAAFRSAESAGLLGSSVVFNDRRVSPDGLGPWLEHATAGVMGNLPTLESRLSWRTRYLDLLWAGLPLAASGPDPLAERMAARGAARIAPCRAPEALADAIVEICGPAREEACRASLAFGDELRWSRVVRPFLGILDDPGAFRRRPSRPSPLDLLRYPFGI